MKPIAPRSGSARPKVEEDAPKGAQGLAPRSGSARPKVEEDAPKGAQGLDDTVELLRLLSLVSRGLPSRRGEEERLLLWLTARFPGISEERLARVMRVPAASVARLQARLERRGLLAANGRLTAEGHAASAITDEGVTRLARAALGQLPRGRLAGARQVLTALCLALAGSGGL